MLWEYYTNYYVKKLRENKGYTQQQMADLIHTHRSGYSKIENNQQDISVDALVYIAKNFGMTVDDVIYFKEKNEAPKEISLTDKKTIEQLQIINELNKEEKSIGIANNNVTNFLRPLCF